MLEQPSPEEMIKLLEDLQSAQVDKREQALKKVGSLATSNVEIVSVLLRIQESDRHMHIIDLARQALNAPAYQAILKKNPNLEKTITSEMERHFQVEQAVNQSREETARLVQRTWVLAGKPIAWPQGCVRCGKPGVLSHDLVDYFIPIQILKTIVVPFLRSTTYEGQHIKPPYCQDCAGAIRKYQDVSNSAGLLGFLATGLVFAGLFGIALIFRYNPDGSSGIVALVSLLALAILADLAANRWYRKLKGNPPKAYTDISLRHIRVGYEITKVQIIF